ncbi:MAG: glycosyltransferase family 87 protein [Thermogemmata sp.]|nr:glycosyltransferase family 87 protein [Thermogemmata sp.]
MFATVPVPAWPGLLHRWLQHPGTTALLWLIAGILAIWLLHTAWHTFDNPPNTPPERCRIDGNCGHTHIDFGAQWLMGRMIATGRGQHLYHRQWLWLTAQEGFSYEQEPPLIRQQVVLPVSQRYGLQPEDDVRHDAEKLMGWLMGEDAPGWGQLGGLVGAVLAPVTPAPLPLWHPPVLQAIQTMATPAWLAQLEQPAIGGPLYPPVQAVWYAPLGLLPPQRAYRLFQVLALVLVFVAAWAVSRLTGQRIPWPLAAIGLLLYPGTRAALDLAQNPTLTLTLLVLGWLAFSRGREILAGCLWGCLAFKPVWAAAFLLVPLLMGRWKFLLAMCMTGVTWIVITLPFVGLHSWWEWLEVGRLANALYCVDDNWIHLSRDLHGIPRRFLHDFSQPADHRDTLLAQALAWTLWGGVLLVTVVVYRLRVQQRRSSGIGAAFLLLGAWLCCYRFMYYDVLLTALAWAALLAEHWTGFRNAATPWYH